MNASFNYVGQLSSLPPFAVEPRNPIPSLEGVTVPQWCRTTRPAQLMRPSVEAKPRKLQQCVEVDQLHSSGERGLCGS